jgi:polysaccharide export outer membrane protein
MKPVRFALFLSAAAALAALLALNWRAQLRTHDRLDALAAALADRPAQPAPALQPPPGEVPRELDRVTLPPYVVEPPDMLQIEAVLKDGEAGRVRGLPDQPISGQFLVRPDGTVGLGLWGSVSVTGLTVEKAGEAIRTHLAKFRPQASPEDLRVVVDVLAYNSKFCYVIADCPDHGGERVIRLPVTGSETVLDAIAGVDGLTAAARQKSVRVFVRRTASGGEQVLPVDWAGIVRDGVTATNYQLRSGDRVYVTRAGG